MNKCKYCCDFSSAKYIIRKSIPLCLGTKMDISLDINENQLDIYLCNSYQRMEASDGMVLKSKINFCPMCGRKLESEE